MVLKYGLEVSREAITSNLEVIINQTFKLLPMREENSNWQKPLQTILETLQGMNSLFIDQDKTFFLLFCKLEGLFSLTGEDDFDMYRRTIFECLGLLKTISDNVGA